MMSSLEVSNSPRAQPLSRRTQRLQRVSKACDFCHSRSIRCKPTTTNDNRCHACVEYAHACTYERPSKKRGIKAKSGDRPGHHGSQPFVKVPQEDATSLEPWQAPHVAGQAVIMDLVEIYCEVVYPIFPFFHQQSFVKKVSRAEFTKDRALFTAVMAMCALSFARVRDGALFSNRWDLNPLDSISPETFIAAADTALPKDLRCTSLDHLRACALLSLVSLQNGDIKNMHFYLGIYQMLVKVDGLHTESNWPADIGVVEIEERRRLYWSMYTLEIFSAACFGSVIASRDLHAQVEFPREVDDDDLESITPSSHAADCRAKRHCHESSSSGAFADHCCCVSWWRGWNFTTQLYRILEQSIDRSREIEMQRLGVSHPSKTLFGVSRLPRSAILDEIMNMYCSLPRRFKEIHQVSFNLKEDRYGFQAANIAATIQLVRMSLFTSEVASTDERCQIVQELLQTFADVPVMYLKAISLPLLHHLAAIGTILGSIFQAPVSDSTYRQIRTVLLALVNLLTKLETGTVWGSGASPRLCHHIHRMDDYMQSQMQHAHASAITRQSSIDYYSATPGGSGPNHPAYEADVKGSGSLSPEVSFPTEL